VPDEWSSSATDPSRRSVRDRAAALYRRHGSDSTEVEAYDVVPVTELAALFERGVDFLQFVGDCADGLDCPGGRLRPEPRKVKRPAVLPGRPRVGRDGAECVRNGSVGGFADVPLDRSPSSCSRTATRAPRYSAAPRTG